MTRIGATLSGMERSLLNRLAEANAEATICSLRIATGQKINHPADDPSTFVRLSGLQARLSNVQTTMSNVTATESMVSQAQSTIDEVNLVDDTEETVRLAYYQDLASNAVAGLYILRQQRASIVALIQQLAGLS